MAPKKPVVHVELPEGNFLVSVHASANRSVVWRFEGNGVVTGTNGVRLRRPSLDGIFRDLHIEWERKEGIGPTYPPVAIEDALHHAPEARSAEPAAPQETPRPLEEIRSTAQRDWVSRPAILGFAFVLLALAGACVFGALP